MSRFEISGMFLLGLLPGMAAFSPAGWADDAGRLPQVEFNRDVRPILAETCFACHGPDENKREADLRLDRQHDALADRGGYRVIDPGKIQSSELIRRITAEDPDERMPPPDSGKSLTEQQIRVLVSWIQQGAPWQGHWAFLQPHRPTVPLPQPGREAGARNAIDLFVLRRLEQESLSFAPEADRVTLIRRLAFDLTGLPPQSDEVDAFVADDSPDAYERQVERLLASKHFGERMASFWLDLVRYADTNGIHGDNHREHAPYRDYVIRSFNENKPFDQFTVEQLAGDLLPDPDPARRIASGYNRLNMTTREGGAQAKEYRAKYAADRVRNASTVWLGATLGCAECHDHKFDPYTMRDFYSFASFFADVQETAVGVQEPSNVLTASQQRELAALDEQIAAARKQLDTQTPELDSSQARWEQEQREPAAGGEPPKDLPPKIAAILELAADTRSAEQRRELSAYYRSIAPELAAARQTLAEGEGQKNRLLAEAPLLLVTTAGAPREMRILPRGNWLDDSGPVVQPAVPSFLGSQDSQNGRLTRLDLARWIVDPQNPLTARVLVNRLWKLMFGQGIVKTPDDFGAQGAWPTHPELLDWLASEFVARGWDIKHLIRLMANSETYRQSSAVGSELRRRDPYNRLLARQSRFRLDAEMVRDNALLVSGLLVDRTGGPSVRPYQPAGYWAHLNFPKREYQADSGAEQYRRGLYTYWCRTFLHPSMRALDAPSREESCVERPRSNTPLAALVMLNDPTYVEAARALAVRILVEGGDEAHGKVQFALRQTLSRPAGEQESAMLVDLYQRHLAQYRSHPAPAQELLHVGQYTAPAELDLAELAAWTSVARVILNLHETITRN